VTDTRSQPESGQLQTIASLWWLTAALGVLSVIAGVIVLLKPSNSLATIAVVIGIFAVIDGIVHLVRAIGGDTDSRGLTVLAGIVSLVIGVLLIRHPIHGVTAVVLLVGIWLIVMGAIRLVLVFDMKGDRGWRALVAGVELIAGIVIVASPKIGIATLAIILGVSLIANGIAMTAAGFILHRARGERA